MGLMLEEQETHINYTREDERAVIYASDSTTITRLDKLATMEGTEWKLESTSKLKNGELIGKTYSCPKELISFRARKVERTLTEEQKKAFAEKMQKSRMLNA